MDLPWFRFYSEAVDDEKLRLLAFEDRWHFVAHLCLKSKGLLDEPDRALRQRKIAVKLGVQVAELDEIQRRLRAVGLLDDNNQPIAWDRRQFITDHKDPTAAERMRDWRERQRNERNGAVTLRAPDSDTETDTETDKPQRARKRATPAPEAFEITPALSEWAKDLGLDDATVKAETEKFLDHHRSKGNGFKDWAAAWRKWMRNAKEWGMRGGSHETHQRADNSAPGRVRQRNAERAKARAGDAIDGHAERVDG